MQKEIQDKIPEQNTGDAVSTRKNELREKLSVHLQEIKELAGKRTKLVDQLTALQSALKKKVSNLFEQEWLFIGLICAFKMFDIACRLLCLEHSWL